jgi:hypothetical protein
MISADILTALGQSHDAAAREIGYASARVKRACPCMFARGVGDLSNAPRAFVVGGAREQPAFSGA